MFSKDQWIAEHERHLNDAPDLTFEQFFERVKELGIDRAEAWEQWRREVRGASEMAHDRAVKAIAEREKHDG